MSTKFVIITSINAPSMAISKFSKWVGWQVVVVGDRKSPAEWKFDGVKYLSIAEQNEEFGLFSKSIPENTYTRKMIGYAYAMRLGATAIFESDDDNLPYADAFDKVEALLNATDRNSVERLRSDIGWLNIYNRFGATNCWPRGFPLQFIKDPASNGVRGVDTKPWGAVQFLADEDPDVDALYRMINGNPVYFARDKQYILDEGTYCPINSQATLWLPETFPLLFLPQGVPDRVTDILRGYIALACLWKMGKSMTFASPVVYQERNAHNLFNDFQQEMLLYNNAHIWANLLLEIEGNCASDLYISALQKLSMVNAIPVQNIEAYEMFLKSAGL
ncbi:hypothetical protein GALL_383250 [mine drainage metagenome]|uniref:Reversibly glycosylated polypeptide n=1 Tax=mine drainage metagenome TaxID=410659 RepID=A0A1J5Q8E4_9ZZZZ